MVDIGKFFDISQFDSYKEDNRREVKRAMVDSLMICGRHILHMLILMVALSFLE